MKDNGKGGAITEKGRRSPKILKKENKQKNIIFKALEPLKNYFETILLDVPLEV